MADPARLSCVIAGLRKVGSWHTMSDENVKLESYMTRQKAMEEVGKFVSRYDRILGFIGFLTAFATFVVKDVFRERLKDFAASIDSAEHAFLLRQDSGALRSQLAGVQITLDLVRSGIEQQQAETELAPLSKKFGEKPDFTSTVTA